MKSIITLCVLVVGVFFIIQALPQDNLVSVYEEQEIKEDTIAVSEKQRNPQREICIGEYCDGSMSGEDDLTVVSVPLITSGGEIGCNDKVFLSPHVIEPKTTAVLNATYSVLFDLKSESEIASDNVRNLVGTEPYLLYETVTLKDGNASVYLSGRLSSIAHCAVPAFRAQIEQAALQFETVNSLEVYLNNNPWNWCDYSDADPSESGCDINSKYWIVEK